MLRFFGLCVNIVDTSVVGHFRPTRYIFAYRGFVACGTVTEAMISGQAGTLVRQAES
jgi:hypothetical protein